MRQRRLKAPASYPVAHYHCMSRVVSRDFVFGPPEREQFVRLLREYERFGGVRVLTYLRQFYWRFPDVGEVLALSIGLV